MHEVILSYLNLKAFFTDSHFFWQKEIDENMNRLICQYILKKLIFTLT
jgi:IS30 family transposase